MTTLRRGATIAPSARGLVSVLGILALAAGGALAGRAVYLHAKAALASVLIRRAWDATLRTGRPVRAWSWADTHPVARLVIPALRYDEIVLEGGGGEALAFGPARMMNGAAPGEPGNIILAGHRTSSFRPLERVRQGDRIVLEWGAGARTYAVSEIVVVEPGDTRHLAPSVVDALTLVTCYPFGYGARSPQRFIVRAVPVEEATSPSLAACPCPFPLPSLPPRRAWARHRDARAAWVWG